MGKTLAACAAVLVIICAVILCPARPDTSALSIRLAAEQVSDLCRVSATLSNASSGPVMYENGPLLEVASLTHGVWSTNAMRRGFTGHNLLGSGLSDGPIDVSEHLAPDAQEVRVGLNFTELSWRGRLGLRMPSNGFCEPASALLFRIDRSRRSAAAWSQAMPLPGRSRQ